MLWAFEQAFRLLAPIEEIIADEAGIFARLVQNADARIVGEGLRQALRQQARLTVADHRDKKARRRTIRGGASGWGRAARGG